MHLRVIAPGDTAATKPAMFTASLAEPNWGE